MRCPTCRRQADADHPVCPRCETDLHQLLRIETLARQFYAQGRRALLAADGDGAEAAFAQAQALSQSVSPHLHRDRAVAALLAGNYKQALARRAVLIKAKTQEPNG